MSEATTYLELRDLRVSYGKVEALHGISVHVEQGEIVTILGANGAGKTTTLTTISGLRKPSGGSILFRAGPCTPYRAMKSCGWALRSPLEGRRVFGTLSVRENLDLGAFTSKDRGRSAKIRKWIFDLFPRLAERKGSLPEPSPAANSRCSPSPARLMADPKVLLLDEPSLGLAPLLVRSIFDSVRKINRQGVTVILVEQNARAAPKLASRGYVIEVGRVVMEDASKRCSPIRTCRRPTLAAGRKMGKKN